MLNQNTAEYTKAERDFLRNIYNILKGKDLSKLDLKSRGTDFRQHSVLFENIELNITQTPVYCHKGTWQKFFSFGEWQFQPGLFERYEIYVLENAQNKRTDTLPPKPNNGDHNVIMMAATMASDTGYFMTDKYDMRPDRMLFQQNPYLFLPAKNIYALLDNEYKRRQTTPNNVLYTIDPIDTMADLKAAQQKALQKINTNCK